MVPRLGIEPRFTASKAAVLPLDDLGVQKTYPSLPPTVSPASGPRLRTFSVRFLGPRLSPCIWQT